jgi:AraC-like DNA-binding protein
MLWKTVDLSPKLHPGSLVDVHMFSSVPNGKQHSDLHEAYEILIPTETRIESYIDGYTQLVEPGQAVLVNAWELTGWHFPDDANVGIAIHFAADFLGEEEFEGIQWQGMFSVPAWKRPQVLSEEGRAEILSIARDFAHEEQSRPPAWLNAVRIGLLRVLLRLYREWPVRTDKSPDGRVMMLGLGRILPAVRLVRSGNWSRATCKSAAQACGMSISRFSHVFRQTTGISFGAFVQGIRLSQATQLLRQTDLTVAAIATRTGYANASHFHRAFHKALGCAPGHYRERGVYSDESGHMLQWRETAPLDRK